MNAQVKPKDYRELLIGCGNNRNKKLKTLEIPDTWQGLTTLDIDAGTGCDVVHDLNVLPLPFADDSFDEIHAYEVLEHCGVQGDWRFFFAQFEEFYRILKPGGIFAATCPTFDSIWTWGDPGHTRQVNEGSLIFLVQPEYAQIGKTAMTDYRPWYKADFDVIAKKTEGEFFAFVLQAIKPARGANGDKR
jgi:SAM-dependent methyltransferase